jgi:phosphate transport system substrate-binding protein
MGQRLRTSLLGAGILLAASLAACAGPTPSPAPPPRLVTQPFYEPVVVEWAVAYRTMLDGALPFDVDTRTRLDGLDRVDQGEAGLLVTSGEPPEGWFATPLGRVALAVVVHPDNPVRDLSIEEVRRLFSGLSDSWSDVGGRDIPVQPVLPLPGEPAGDVFSSLVLDGVEPWPGTLLAPTAAAMAQSVGEEPGAVGILPLAAVPESLRAIRIEGVLPGDSTVASGAYPLTANLLATAPSEPASPLRDFLVWIQSRGS